MKHTKQLRDLRAEGVEVVDAEESSLPLPRVRCLEKGQAARYLGVGVTLLEELEVPHIKLGRRCVYDVVDSDAWLDQYKQRGRAR